MKFTGKLKEPVSHPPCEDVSWNAPCGPVGPCGPVILLVRMWVEIYPIIQHPPSSAASSSLWGCELKCYYLLQGREAFWSSSLWGCELKFPSAVSWAAAAASSSLWGCELKCIISSTDGRKRRVILLVRMWVEIRTLSPRCRRCRVILLVRMWVEIFFQVHKPCFNAVILLVRMWVEI